MMGCFATAWRNVSMVRAAHRATRAGQRLFPIATTNEATVFFAGRTPTAMTVTCVPSTAANSQSACTCRSPREHPAAIPPRARAIDLTFATEREAVWIILSRMEPCARMRSFATARNRAWTAFAKHQRTHARVRNSLFALKAAIGAWRAQRTVTATTK